jgi:serine/threonine protein kinase
MAPKSSERQTIVFTDGYAPPEQVMGRAETRSDLYALAATLYHLATGKAPEPMGETGRHLKTQLADPKSPLQGQHRWFWELLQINLSEDPNDRYPSVEDFKADLVRRRVTKEVQCDKCRKIVAAHAPYCTHCAEPLSAWRSVCMDCGSKSSIGSRFCIHCGNRLR